MTKENLEKLSLGTLIRNIISEEIAYRGTMHKLSGGMAPEPYVRDMVNQVYAVKLNPLYAELDRREGKICVCSRNEDE